MSSLNLYEIETQLAALEQELLESGGELTPEIEERYEELLQAEEDKIEGYIAVIQQNKAAAKAIKEEEKRLKKRRKAHENTSKRLKDRMAEMMQMRGEDAYDTKLGKVRLQEASRRSLIVDVDEGDLPDRFKRVRISPDKSALQSALEEGDEEAASLCHLDDPTVYARIY